MATQDNSIISITSKKVSGNEEQGVDARSLYNFLEVDTRFSDWFSRRVEEYGFLENQDFVILLRNEKNSGRGRKAVDYFLTLEMAKELAMVEKNDKGREARRSRVDPDFIMIHKSVLDNTGKALVWMGDYGVTSQPFYGSGAGQPPFIDGRPVMTIGDSSTRYYLTKYVGNVMESQRLATEEVITNHLRGNFPALEVVGKEIMCNNLMHLANELVNMSGQFITSAEINKGLTKAMRGAA